MRNSVLFLCLLLAGTGCGPSGPAQTVENYFPFAVGNRWTFRESGDTTTAFTLTITRAFTNAHNTRVYELLMDEDTTYSAYVDGQVVLLDAPDDTLGDILLKEPFAVGSTWYADPSDTSTVCRIEDTEAGVATHAGEFTDCIRVSTRQDDAELSAFYFAPGVGLVKRTAPGDEDTELYEYDLK